jgi:hypothetical protein
MTPDERDLRNRALDAGAPLDERIAALRELERSASGDAKDDLLALGERDTEPAAILEAAGSALAALAHRGAPVTEFDMRNLQAATYDAFCAWEP